MKKLLYILLLIPIIGLSQDPYDPEIVGYLYANPNSEQVQMLNHIINQNNDIKQQNEQLIDLYIQGIEIDQMLLDNMPSKLMNLLSGNIFWGDSAGIDLIRRYEEDLFVFANIIICDTCTGVGLPDSYNLIIDVMNPWIQTYLVDYEVVQLLNCRDDMLYYTDVRIKRGLFFEAKDILHIGIARESNLLPNKEW